MERISQIWIANKNILISLLNLAFNKNNFYNFLIMNLLIMKF